MLFMLVSMICGYQPGTCTVNLAFSNVEIVTSAGVDFEIELWGRGDLISVVTRYLSCTF